MKRNIRTILIAAAAFMTAGCGSQENQKSTGAQAAEMAPTVAVEQVFIEEVPLDATFTSTVQAYVKNNIVPQTGGRIKKINVEIGDHVKKGQTLAEIDKAQLQQAQLQLQNLEAELGRLRTLYQAGGLAKSDLDAIELQYNVAKTQVENLEENTELKSPIDGVVTARNYDVGDMCSVSGPIFTVEQITPVKFRVGISESDYSRVHKGDQVTIKADAFADKTFEGKVERIFPTIDPATRTFTAEVVVPNKNAELRPGMFIRVVVNLGKNNSVVVPDMSIVKQQGSGERFIYVLNEDGTVSYKKVELGRRMGARYEVLSGLEDGDIVVTGGQIRLKDGIKVTVNE